MDRNFSGHSRLVSFGSRLRQQEQNLQSYFVNQRRQDYVRQEVIFLIILKYFITTKDVIHIWASVRKDMKNCGN